MDSAQEHDNPFASPLADDSIEAPPTGWDDAERIRREHLSREASIKSVGILYYIGAVLSAVLFVSLLVTVISFGGPVGAMELVMILVMGASAILSWWVARGLRALNPSIRPLAIGLCVLNMIVSFRNPIALLIGAYILWLLVGEKSKYVFSPKYKEVIHATPHVKYKTSMVVWILLAVLLAVLVVSVFAALGLAV